MWKTVKLKDVCSVFTDGDWIETKDQSAEGIRLVQTGNVKTGSFADRKDKARYISNETSARLNCTEVMEGDILVSRLPEPVGRACVIPKLQEKAITAVDCTVIRTKEEVLPTYLNYYMQSPQYFSLVQEKVTGATRQRISRKNLGEVLVSIPPLAEQQRIVAKLDAAFAEIDKKTQTALEKIENAYSFERNILDAALSGIDTTKHSYTLQQLLDMGWIVSHLDGNHGSDYPRKNEFIDKGVPYISANCVIDGNVVMSKAKYLSADRAAQLRKGIARNGDVLFAHNATVGPTAILQTSEEKVILGTSLTYFRCNDETISNEYLLAFMRSRQFIKQYNEVMRQATRNQVPITKQRTFTFLIPEIDVQHKVAKTVGTLSELTAEIVRATDASKKQLNALKAAILARELQPPYSEAA